MAKKSGRIIAICRSKTKKENKTVLKEGFIRKNWGLDGDAHVGQYHKQISLLSTISIKKMKDLGAKINFGELHENLVVDGMILHVLPIGTKLKIGQNILLEITQIGKNEDYFKEFDGKRYSSIMAKEGVFARVLEGGIVKKEDGIEVISE